MNSATFFPRQRAILFADDETSGATIGHFCTVVEIDPDSRREYPHSPDDWLVGIYLPHRQEFREVRAAALLGTQERDDSPLPPFGFQLEIYCELVTDDNARIEGRYRLRRRWEPFIFEKRPQPVATYDLFGEVEGADLKMGRLLYYVPNEDRLDQAYVWRALTELFSTNSRQS